MAIIDPELVTAEKRMADLRDAGYAIAARYDRRTSRVVVNLNTGLQLAFPIGLVEALRGRHTISLFRLRGRHTISLFNVCPDSVSALALPVAAAPESRFDPSDRP